MGHNNTSSEEYFAELNSNTSRMWKKYLPLQLPYRFNLKRQNLGKVLEIGAGLGRNQAFLQNSVGVEHNELSVKYCQTQGYNVMLPSEFHSKYHAVTGQNAIFDSILMSHVLEHIEFSDQVRVLREYVPYLKPSSRIFLVTPQEVGHKSTDSHITWTDFNRLREIISALESSFSVVEQYSFPFPRPFGKIFKYNEFNLLASRN